MRAKTKPMTNTEIVSLAVYLLGGDSHYVDTEDVAMKANEIAPGRFAWRKYPSQINLELVRVRLSEAKKAGKGGYLLGAASTGWLLTQEGVRIAAARATQLGSVELSRTPLSARERQWQRSERGRMLSEEAYRKVEAGRLDEITHSEVESFFRLNDYVMGKAREHKVTRIVNVFSEDPELGKAVVHMAKAVLGRQSLD